LYLAVVLSLCGLLILGTVALAQDSQPPERPGDHEGGERPPGEGVELERDGARPFGIPAPAMRAAGAASLSPAVTLGQPGLSFRYVQTFGVTEEGYLTDGDHLNAPSGLFIDGSNNLYVVEDHGYRVLRYDSSGVNTLSIGVASLCVEGNNPTRFCTPRDVTVDSGGNIWVATGNRVVKFNSSGAYQTQLPVPNSSGGWSSGNDTTHFRRTNGIAIDNLNGRMFVADRNNHRVQVYSYTGGLPVYSATIGITGTSGTDNSHLNSPERLAIDSLGRLYVVDRNNNRVQRCTLSGSWSCLPYGTGVGSMTPLGISVDSANWVYIYDNDNGRVVKCSPSGGGACSELITDMSYANDIAVDSSFNVYAGAYGHGVVRQYDSGGTPLGNFIGYYHQSYIPDSSHIFTPWGIAVGGDGSIYVSENLGYRILKLNASGAQQWAVGDPGGWGDEDDQFSWLEGKPAIASNGKIYIPDSGNYRVQIFNSDGTYNSTFGSYGTGNNQFYWPTGIAISPVNGDIYIADYDNHRVQVYNSNFGYRTTLGVTGSSGTDAAHFKGPYDVAVDSNGNIYVADYENYRVQKCNLSGTSYTCTTFTGETGVIPDDGDFGHLQPIGVAVDSSRRVYVVDEWNYRVQVFDSNGAYLTTIGGSWGSRTGQFRDPVAVTIDNSGMVYVSDRRNNRVQKFAPGVPGWAQVNINGFGDLTNGNIHTLGAFGGELYAGTYNRNGSQIWKKSAGSNNWTQAAAVGLGNTNNIGINHLVLFNSQFYAGVRNDTEGARIYRSNNGSTWDPVVTSGFTDTNTFGVYRLASFNNQIYAGTGIFANRGAEIWRSPSGDSGTWTLVVGNGYDSSNNYIMRSSEVHSGYLYFGTMNIDTTTGMTTTGGIVIRSSSGDNGSWTKVTDGGFGDNNNYVISSLVSFNGYLYASTGRWNFSGVQVWRCQDCDSQSDWQKVVDNGFGNPYNWGIGTLQIFDGNLYLVIANEETGMEVWCSSTGDSDDWTQIGSEGFGDSNNDYPYFNNVTTFNDNLYIGTENNANGPEVWLYLHKKVYLPLVRR